MLIIRFYHGVGFCFVVMIHDKQVKRQPEHFKEENILLSLTDLWNDKNESVSAAHLIFFSSSLSCIFRTFNEVMKNVAFILVTALKMTDLAHPHKETWVGGCQLHKVMLLG